MISNAPFRNVRIQSFGDMVLDQRLGQVEMAFHSPAEIIPLWLYSKCGSAVAGVQKRHYCTVNTRELFHIL